MHEVIERFPAPPTDRPVEEWKPAELLTEATRLGLMRVLEIVTRPVTDDQNPREQRRGELGISVAKLLAHVQLATLQRTADDRRSEEFMREVEAFERKLYGKRPLANRATGGGG